MSHPAGEHAERKRPSARSCTNESFVLPWWAFDTILRPAVRGLSRLIGRFEYHGTEHIPPRARGGYIIAANHQTYFDPFWISVTIQTPMRYLAWNAAFDWFLIGRIIPALGAIPIALEGGDRSAMRRARDWLRAGNVIVIFPEGGRGLPSGALARFKPGAVRLALETGVPILPVTISGAHKVWNKEQRAPHRAGVTITYHPLRAVQQRHDEDLRLCARRESDELARIIASALKVEN